MNNGRNGYQSKMDNALTAAINNWWNQLTKEEILAYIADCPQITADDLRTILYNEEVQLFVTSKFDTTTQQAQASFFGEAE